MELSDLVESIDIVEYISQFVDMEQRGDEWWGLSPFKDEKTPSFSVRREPPVFYDYSSGRGGNAFSFTKFYYNCGNAEAVEILQKYAGIDGATMERKKKLLATMVCKRFTKPKGLQKSSRATVLPEDFMIRFEKTWDKLMVWKAEGISTESINRFQVYYDPFTNCLVYPIRNPHGDIVNVGYRTLDPKYKEKGLHKYGYRFAWGTMDVIYGLSENMEYIQEKKEIIMFEGCKSVLIADSWGIKNCCSLLTSHLNQHQLKILAKLGYRVVFALDKDVRIRDDKNIEKLKHYVNVEYIYDMKDLLGDKDSPVDKGKETFESLYQSRFKLR